MEKRPEISHRHRAKNPGWMGQTASRQKFEQRWLLSRQAKELEFCPLNSGDPQSGS